MAYARAIDSDAADDDDDEEEEDGVEDEGWDGAGGAPLLTKARGFKLYMCSTNKSGWVSSHTHTALHEECGSYAQPLPS